MATLDAHASSRRALEHDDSLHPLALPGDGWLRRSPQGAHDVPRGRRQRSRRGLAARSRWRGLPGRTQVVDAAQVPDLVSRRQRRRVGTGDVQGPLADRARPAPTGRGRHHRGLRAAGHVRSSSSCAASSRSVSNACSRRSTTPTSYGALGSKIFGSDFSLDVVVHPGAGAYICGEETALIEALEGKRGFPRIKPPFFPAVTGLYGEPTVVNNVETMSNLPWIVNNGGAAFAALGGGRSTGTRLFALAGRVNNPGVFEIEMVKNTFRDLIYDPAARRRRDQRQQDQGDHPRRRVGPVVRSRAARPPARTRRGRREGIDARIGIDRRHGRDRRASCARRGASRSSSRANPAASARPVAKARAGSSARCTDWNTAAVAWRTSTCCSTSATTSRPV